MQTDNTKVNVNALKRIEELERTLRLILNLSQLRLLDSLVEGHLEMIINTVIDKKVESAVMVQENTGIKDFAIQVVKYLEDHYGEHNYKAFLEVVNDKLK